MSNEWSETLADLERRRAAARAMGGSERLAKQHGQGRLDARQRVTTLLDPGSFQELGTLVGADVPSDGLVVGSGHIEGRPVMVGAEDFTTQAGTIGSGSNSKRYRIAELALKHRMPLVMLLDGAGYRASGHGGARTPVDLLAQAKCSGSVPIVTGILGASAGHGALIAPMSDFVVMTEGASVFAAGPPVVKQSTGEDVTKDQLGGPGVAVASGLVHNVAVDDPTALQQIRDYLRYFPSSAWSYPSSRELSGPRLTPELLEIVPRDNKRGYDMRHVIDVVVDQPDWLEVSPRFGGAVICALAHLGGHPIAVVASQPQHQAGAIDVPAADKAAHFISVADAYHLPLVFLSDNPGMMPGTSSEKAGILRSGARMFAAQTLATTPKLHVTMQQGIRLRVDGHGDGQLRWSGRDLRLSGCDARRDERERHGLRNPLARRGHRGSASGRACRVLRLVRAPALRRTARSRRDTQRTARRSRAGVVVDRPRPSPCDARRSCPDRSSTRGSGEPRSPRTRRRCCAGLSGWCRS